MCAKQAIFWRTGAAVFTRRCGRTYERVILVVKNKLADTYLHRDGAYRTNNSPKKMPAHHAVRARRRPFKPNV